IREHGIEYLVKTLNNRWSLSVSFCGGLAGLFFLAGLLAFGRANMTALMAFYSNTTQPRKPKFMSI
ncbi:MAG TPA: hypothetical protein PK874_05120, partial [Desulfobacteraceae bacterium]|nr:hypothetical protein [Desulfobacteraceae bacterium]